MPTYTDLDLSFSSHPVTKDVLKKIDLEAVKQSLRRIFFSERFDKPFDPNFGLGIKHLLFETNSYMLKPILLRKITEQLEEYEPRVVLDDLTLDQLDHELEITLLYHVIGITDGQKVTFTLERIR